MTPIPMPDKDGFYTCDICCMKIRVGNGGSKNFLQHSGSPGCLKVEQKGNSKPKASQPRTIHSYFTNATQSGASSKKTQAVAPGVVPFIMPQAAPPPRSSLPVPGHACDPLGEPRTTRGASACPEQGADGHTLALLANITHVAKELPLYIPEAEEHNNIALLGYGVNIEAIEHHVRCGPLGVKGLTRYIHGFVVAYGISGGLLEGKLKRLLKVIECMNQMDKSLTTACKPGFE
ncbi:hypothetical protein EDB84DRAFT_1438724 [Lactarius hengduanensis]|nr:hypothetical protein EDB84DRAFT_1438724 [Lactarius hengduanensis]